MSKGRKRVIAKGKEDGGTVKMECVREQKEACDDFVFIVADLLAEGKAPPKLTEYVWTTTKIKVEIPTR